MKIEVLNGIDSRLPETAPKPTSVDGQHESSLSVSGLHTGEAGLWECDEGTFTADRSMSAEVCYIISGTAVVTTEGDSEGQLVTAGTLFVLPRGWRGSWTVRESIRKAYVVLTDEPSGLTIS